MLAAALMALRGSIVVEARSGIATFDFRNDRRYQEIAVCYASEKAIARE